ncbi:MAG: hypothetical protein M0T74_13065 [Desulfitobacterium hafniense]|nr:hypothetical protein [Desulfitobacterium hafniense]
MSNINHSEKGKIRLNKRLLGDCMLKTVLSMVEQQKTSIKVTLNIKGAIVSGTLINSKEYWDSISEYLKGELGIETFKDFKKISSTVYGSHGSEGDYLSDLEYVYLKDARVHYASQDTAPIDQGVFWCGKLSSIDGVVFGTLGV